jgi:RNA polymerase sigma-70 factor (ECF subfamily)
VRRRPQDAVAQAAAAASDHARSLAIVTAELVNDSRPADVIRCRTRPPWSRQLEAAVDQRELVERARRGDPDAFARLVDPALARLDAAARLILRDPELARDAVQETLIRAWRELPGLRDPVRFDAWLHRLVVNACLDLLRRRRRRPMEVELSPIDMPSATDHAGALADRELVDGALRRLDPGHRAVVALHYLLGMPLPAVAASLGIPLGTAKSRLHNALTAMRIAVEAEPEAAPIPAPGGQVS